MNASTEIEAALERRGQTRMLPGLDRIKALLDAMGNPQRAYPTIHVAGTNGKTSTSRMIESLLRAHGLRTGRHTSPHLDSVAERIALDGEPISAERLREVYTDVAPYVDLIDAANRETGDTVTYFEFVTALAFSAFADAPVDAAVIEVGLGGRWDATNVIDSHIAAITPIGMDHQAILGETIGKIATEKAGIIAEDAVVVSAAQPVEAVESLLTQVASRNATLAREGLEFGVRDRELAFGGQRLTLQGLSGIYSNILLPLHGAHQAQNASVALAAVEAFFGAGADKSLSGAGADKSFGGAGADKALDPDVVREAFAQVTSPGRLERMRTSPTIVIDAAHNPHGLTAVVAALSEAFSFSRLVAIVGIAADKDAKGMLEVLEPVADQLVVTRNSSERSMDPDELAAVAVDIFGPDRVNVSLRMDDAIESAVAIAEEEDFEGGSPLSSSGVLVTGSVVTAADARRLLR
ncbi:MAG TPA: folylpolyglutamate synthase/dihydrofolate synthase family protein [Mycobacteriales bacterium]|nr:folylpolyglutamate synthase/dihydrofolate synthase family protein [Mycobacteriales bacterium]